MKWGESPIWEPAKDALRNTIDQQAKQPSARFSIVAFTDKGTIPDTSIIAFEGRNYSPNKQVDIDNLFEREINSPHSKTNIVSALRKGFTLCNPAMENRIFLFTDGKHNCSGNVEQCLAQWCANHPAGTRLFYVMMTSDAVDNSVLQCLDACEDGYAIQCENRFIPQIIDIGSQLTASTLELDQDYAVSFSEADPVPVQIKCDDPLFTVSLAKEKAAPYTLRLHIAPKGGLSTEELNEELSQLQDANGCYNFPFDVMSADKRYIVANPTVWVSMKNLPPRKLYLFGGKTDSIARPTDIRWHDRFLWSKATPEQAVEIDFAPIFQAPDAGTRIAFTLSEIDSGNPIDYTLSFNGTPLSPNAPIVLSPRDSSAKLPLVFNHDAKQGRRTFALTPAQISHLDIINGMSAEAFPPLNVDLKYDIVWNPLKTFCFWLAIVVLALLLVWFFFVKPMKYPKVNVTRLQITGDGLYVSKNVKGCRRIVLSARKQRQNVLSKFFTGSILYICRPEFTSDVHIVRGHRKSLRFQLPQAWGISPTATVARNQQATLVNSNTGQKYTINVF